MTHITAVYRQIGLSDLSAFLYQQLKHKFKSNVQTPQYLAFSKLLCHCEERGI